MQRMQCDAAGSHQIRWPGVLLCGIILAQTFVWMSCKKENPNQVDAAAMRTIKRLALADLYCKDHVEYIGVSGGDTQADKQAANSLAGLDIAAIIERVAATRAFQEIKPLDGADTKTSGYAAAINDPFSANPSVLAAIATMAKADGLLWVGREYRVRGVRGFSGDRYAKWTGEVVSHIFVFDSAGHLALKAEWLNQSTQTYEGSAAGGAQLGPLLEDAVNRSAETTATILAQTRSGMGIPIGLLTEEKVESSQETKSLGHEIGVTLRGLFLVMLVVIVCVALATKGIPAKSIGLILSAGVVYLLIGRGWWKDTIMAILDFVKEAIFG